MVGVINAINADPDCVTVASCCGHNSSRVFPYITIVQPESKIKEIKAYLTEVLGWDVVSISMWNEVPDSLINQMGHKFIENKVYVGYYNMSDEINPDTNFCYTWSEDDLQVA
jgi:hypothetical protein